MKIDVLETKSGITKLVLSGRMDIQGAMTADMAFSVTAGAKKKVVVDLSDVTFMASLGLNTLKNPWQAKARGWSFSIRSLTWRKFLK